MTIYRVKSDSIVTSQVDDLKKLEDATRALQKKCAESPGNPADGTAFQSATHGLYKSRRALARAVTIQLAGAATAAFTCWL